jgi:hypothetical protein
MPSTLHEALVDMFRHRPSLAAELLADALGMALPAYQHAQLQSGDLTDMVPTEYRADAVVVLNSAKQAVQTATGTAVLAVVVEAQLSWDGTKRWSWPVYLATLRARLRCPAVLLVVCADAKMATWCAAPIDLGHPGRTLSPLVLGPDRVPVVTDLDEARRAPELAVLSAMAHGNHPDRFKVLDALFSGFGTLDKARVTLYSDVVWDALPEAARHYLEALMTSRTYEYQSPFVLRYVLQGRAEGEAKGEAKGEARALLSMLDARGIDVPGDARARITECADIDQLDTWVRRAATVESIADLFA